MGILSLFPICYKKKWRSFDRRLVPGVGIEPTRPCGQQILSLPRLPFRHPGKPFSLLKTGAKVHIFSDMAIFFFKIYNNQEKNSIFAVSKSTQNGR